jgi:hypothetical protein
VFLSPSNLERIFAAIVALVLGNLLIGSARESWTNYWLLKDAQQGVAEVTGEAWSGHNVVSYAYRVDQKQFKGADRRSWQDTKYANVQIGGTSVVYFSASHPWLSLINRPRTVVEGLPVLILVWMIEALLVITVVNPRSRWALKMTGARRVFPARTTL